MHWIALKMLFDDRAKYFGLVFGVAFSALLISQQSAFCVGLINTTPGVLYDVNEADIWVMDPRTETIDSSVAMPEKALGQVRGVAGVKWAVPFFKGNATLQGADGLQQVSSLFGVDESSLVGLPREMVAGSLESIRRPGAVFVDEAGYRLLWPEEPVRVDRVLEINDRRAIITGVVRSSPQFASNMAIFTTYKTALTLSPGGRQRLSFVLVGAAEGLNTEHVSQAISKRTGLRALPRGDFIWSTLLYFLRTTPLAPSFGAIVFLGIIVGSVIIGLTLSLFIRDHLKQFAALRAMGVSRWVIIRMVAVQSFVAGWTGYGIGVGVTALGLLMGVRLIPDFRSFFLPWQIVAGTAGLEIIMIILSMVWCLRTLLKADPALVFRS